MATLQKYFLFICSTSREFQNHVTHLTAAAPIRSTYFLGKARIPHIAAEFLISDPLIQSEIGLTTHRVVDSSLWPYPA